MSGGGLALWDESNHAFAAQSKMRELCVGSQKTGAVFGVMRRLHEQMSRMSGYRPVFLADGQSWRYKAFDDYKGSRDKPATTKQEREQVSIREDLKSQKPLIKQMLDLLGVPRMYAFNMEADDLAAIVTRSQAGKRPIALLSGDKDWIQLIRENVVWLDLIHDRRLGFKTFSQRNKSTESVGIGFERKGEWITLKHPQQWADVKALMGDTSDDIEGVGGIGEKGAVELVATYGSVADFSGMVMDKSIDVDTLPKKFRDFALAESKYEIYMRNDRLMNLHHPLVPKPEGMKLTKPKLDKAGFRDFCAEWCFQSVLTDFDRFIAPFEKNDAPTA